jgi:hypothetical protein
MATPNIYDHFTLVNNRNRCPNFETIRKIIGERLAYPFKTRLYFSLHSDHDCPLLFKQTLL